MKKAEYLVKAAVIASAYAALTLILAPLSYGIMQVRISEGLIGLAVFTPAAIPGLTVGCFLSGVLGPNGIVDAVIGCFASFLGSLGTYALRKHKYAALGANVVSNAIIIGCMFYYFYDINMSLVACILWVACGEAISCFGIGSLVIRYLSIKGNKFL